MVLLSDSKAAIQAIGPYEAPSSKNILECRALLERLPVEGLHIVLQWIPGHCDILGNDQDTAINDVIQH
ncbi:hypothetical protein CDAR_466071 [Caerostris darwini]|uniref:RNase H type-1 domain-containing protein n=1 Tax=Caerostris darwini TaxID=1538125 RepID=A0AAV4WME1_9ARAC|nr:hypothetical protein CDAR_466071 [Caerostris darwini]